MNQPALLSTASGSRDWPTAVVSALPEELAGLRARVRAGRRLRLGACRVICGRLGRIPVVLAVTGDGPQRAGAGLGAVIDALAPGRVLALGLAGALAPALGPGTLVLARRIHDERGPAPDPDLPWLERALRLEGTCAGIAVSTERILLAPSEKRDAWRGLGTSELATVDLESAAWARAAADRGVPFLVARAVSDAAWEKLPIDFNRFRDESGALRRGRVLTHALTHPASLAGLWRLRGRVATCADRLGRFTVALLEGGSS